MHMEQEMFTEDVQVRSAGKESQGAVVEACYKEPDQD